MNEKTDEPIMALTGGVGRRPSKARGPMMSTMIVVIVIVLVVHLIKALKEAIRKAK